MFDKKTARAALLSVIALSAHAASASQLIINAQLVDGSGTPARAAAVRIEGDRIVEIGALTPTPAEEVIDARGRVLAPGFIDTHSHHDLGLLKQRDASAAISQGITTIIVGQDGGSQLPLADFFSSLERTPASVNVASYVGHGTLRGEVLGKNYQRHSTPVEIEAMRRLLQREMQAGALGLSSGLEYEPGSYAAMEELVALAQESGRHGGRYISHMRSEDRGLDAAIGELLAIGEQACLPVQISHMKVAIRTRWGDAPAVLRRLDEARARGIDVSADVYPYEYWQSTLTIFFLPERNYEDRATAEMALRDIAAPEDITLSVFEADPSLVGKSIAQIAAQRRTDAAATLMSLIRESQSFGKDGGEEVVIAKSMSEADTAQLIAWPQTNIGSDGQLHDAHPRGAGAFTRVLRTLVREGGQLTLEQAVHKMTGLSAAHTGITDRGIIRAGAYADLVLFDPRTVADRATSEQPGALSEGIERVWVNGGTVWQAGRATHNFSGRTLRRSPATPPFTCERASH